MVVMDRMSSGKLCAASARWYLDIRRTKKIPIEGNSSTMMRNTNALSIAQNASSSIFRSFKE